MLNLFHDEIKLIQSPVVKSLLTQALSYVPGYFRDIPASSSGKYHPSYTLGYGGLVRHTKAVARVAHMFFRHPYIQFSDDEKDCIIAAILLHDSFKGGPGETPKGTDYRHPLLVKENIFPVEQAVEADGQDPELSEQYWDLITELISTHMGPYTSIRDSEDLLPEPTTPIAKFVHYCDYIASRKMITIDIFSPLEETKEASPTPAWRDEPASDKQVNLLKRLEKDGLLTKEDRRYMNKLAASNEFTKGNVSDLIDKVHSRKTKKQ